VCSGRWGTETRQDLYCKVEFSGAMNLAGKRLFIAGKPSTTGRIFRPRKSDLTVRNEGARHRRLTSKPCQRMTAAGRLTRRLQLGPSYSWVVSDAATTAESGSFPDADRLLQSKAPTINFPGKLQWNGWRPNGLNAGGVALTMGAA
jgi:hypothetical protein